MFGVLVLSLFFTSAFSSYISSRNCYSENGRYFYFPDDGTDREYHLVDSQENTHMSVIKFRTDVPSKNKYWLFTRANPTIPQVLRYGNESSITSSNLDPKKTTVFLAHGWNGNATNRMCTHLTDAFLHDSDANIIVVDWSFWASRSYPVSKDAVMIVGQAIGKFAIWLELFGVSLDNVHMVGFSLGAHVVGCAGRSTNSKVKRITGLDPAGPLWYEDRLRLVKTDAQHVVIIHTNTQMFGYSQPCGSADFYPNGGKLMPECKKSLCSHYKSYEYMAQSLIFKNLHALECDSYNDAIGVKGVCAGATYVMGDNDLSHNRSGIFRVDTMQVENIIRDESVCF